MHLRIWKLCAKIGPFAGGFLNFVFPKQPMPLLQDRMNTRVWLHLGHSNQMHIVNGATRIATGIL